MPLFRYLVRTKLQEAFRDRFVAGAREYPRDDRGVARPDVGIGVERELQYVRIERSEDAAVLVDVRAHVHERFFEERRVRVGQVAEIPLAEPLFPEIAGVAP